MSQTTRDLLDQVRTQLDEVNSENITDAQILQALNRAQRRAVNITARKYEDLFWATTSITTVSGQFEYDIPDDAFGQRVEKLETVIDGVAWEIRRISNHKRTQYINKSQVARPFYYSIQKNKIVLYPRPTGSIRVDVHYSQRPQSLVLPQGRITGTGNDGSKDFILVSGVGSDISTSTTGFGSYLNLVDRTHGGIKGTLQISEITPIDAETTQIKFKATGLTRTSVLGNTVTTSLPADLELDDWCCLVNGTAVPELPEAYTDYLLQYAVTEMRRRLGEPTQEEYAQLKDIEKELERMWVGRELSTRVRKSNDAYGSYLGGNLRRLLT